MAETRSKFRLIGLALEKVRESGIRYAASIAIKRIVPRSIFSMSRILLMEAGPSNAASIHASVGRWAVEADLSLLMEFGHSESAIRGRFARSDRAWLAIESGHLLGYCWFTSERYLDEASGLEFSVRADEAWLYDAMVAKRARGRGIYPRLFASAVKQLAHEGTTRVRILVDCMNRNSVRAHLAGGAKRERVIRTLTIGGVRILPRHLDLRAVR